MIFLRFDDGESDRLINLQHIITMAEQGGALMVLTIDGQTHMLPCGMRGFLKILSLTTMGAAGYAVVDLGASHEETEIAR